MRILLRRLVCLIALLAACLAPGQLSLTMAEEIVEDTVVAEEESLSADERPKDEGAGSRSANKPSKPSGGVAPPASPGNLNGRYAMPDDALELFDPRTYRLKVIIRIEAPDGAVKNVIATGPIPMDWPEQRVRLISQKISPQCKVSEQILKGQAALIKFQVPQIPKGGSAFVERLYEITRYRTKFALGGEELKFARGVPAELKDQVAGARAGRGNQESANDRAGRVVAQDQPGLERRGIRSRRFGAGRATT